MKNLKIDENIATKRNLFYKFLETKGLVDVWKKNVYELNYVHLIPKKRQLLYFINPFYHPRISNGCTEKIINDSFIWGKTREGSLFWCGIHHEWAKYCHQHYNK